jgi:alkanesulfonate monooxygenase SsuD/methylene tetrahydromethanopterin reductase-like flavin-dependent oxidoreductase (luciferase family)
MKFAVRLPRTGPFASAGAIIKAAQKAEELGYDAVTVNDHISWSFERR